MQSKPPSPPSPNKRASDLPPQYELGAIKIDTRTGVVSPNPSGSINVTKKAGA